ncbi:MAG: endonuclease III domain-containing protein [bacterium]
MTGPTRLELLQLLDRIEQELPEARRLHERLRARRRAPLLWVLVHTVLSHQSTGDRTYRASRRVYARYRSLDRLAGARPTELEPLVREVGLGRLKAARLVALARAVRGRWGGLSRLSAVLRSAPLEEAWCTLLELPGIGPKSAAVVLLSRYGRPRFPVDTNILRVARHLGWVHGRDPEVVRDQVERALGPDPEALLRAHAYLLALGRATQRGLGRDLWEKLRGG